MSLSHTTVLLSEAVDALRPEPIASPQTYLDGTYGRGGHSRLLLSRMGPQDRLIAFDKDQAALEDAARVQDPRFAMVHGSFADMAAALDRLGLRPGQVHGVLLDLGISSPQVDDAERGFSFRFDAPLDMRMDQSRGLSAADFLAAASMQDIARVLRDYGEERFAGPLARAIVGLREAGTPVRRTGELAALCERVVRKREPGQHAATRSFQALRIEVNRELDDLQAGLEAAARLLAPRGRLVVISFHSLEDRMVKRFIAHHARHEVDRRAPFAEPKPLMLRELGRIRPGAAEVAANPRARSAVMRMAERTEVPWPGIGSGEGLR